MATVLPVNVPPREAVEYFRRKGYTVAFDWRDLMRQAHARAFTVAKVTRIDLLQDINAAVDRAIADGISPEQFQRELTPILQAKGWWGRAAATDPVTGETRDVQLGSPRRLLTIYDTNLRTSLSAGRWGQIQEHKARRPYLRYIHRDSPHPRARHLAWNNLVLSVDHPFWKTHFPPNGWHCRCSTQTLSDAQLEEYGYAVGEAPPIEYTTWTNTRTGQTEHVPAGIDPGFDRNPGIDGAEYYDQLLADRLHMVPADLKGPLRR